MTETPELLAPAGNWECVRAAVANGADAVYFGLPRFNARLRADNFTEAELPEVVEFCHRRGVKAYVVFNTLIFTAELDDAAEYLRLLNAANVDALIVQDIGLVRLARALVPELPIHASTQMTITSPEGAEFARSLGVERIVLAREVSLRELEKFQGAAPALEVFVHGALCVAYSGQCLTSEALGQRSANRGECAQACRMPYELIVDDVRRDLGDQRYLLSPQDLSAVAEIPALLERGVISFKIEGRLKTPEYVAAVCQVYRRALDAALAGNRRGTTCDAERYQLEMAFSRGLFSGWMHGVDHQRLAPARFGKKRGPLAGRIARVGADFVEFDPLVPLAPGDGIVFDTGGDTDSEQGGRIYEVRGRRFHFARGHVDFRRLTVGDRVWKTDDPVLNKKLTQSFGGRIEPRRRVLIDLRISGKAGAPLTIEASLRAGLGVGGARDSRAVRGDSPRTRGAPSNSESAPEHLRRDAEGCTRDACSIQPNINSVHVASTIPLAAARTAPLNQEKLREHLGRFGESGYALGEMEIALEGDVILPIGELNRLRRELVFALDAARRRQRPERAISWRELLTPRIAPEQPPHLHVLCRTSEQLAAALTAGVREIYVDYEDIRRYGEAVRQVRAATPDARVFLATPRIQKAGESGFFRLIENALPDGVLIRNLGAIEHFRQNSTLRKVGDFSLNIANPLTAQHFLASELERVTISYDLNVEQVLDLLATMSGSRLELTIHQHLPMFHMEHCVFAAFLSKGSSFLDCGRPCDRHRVQLRDRVGMEHPLRADVGCRNTLFNAVPQTGAGFFEQLTAAGLRNFRVELLDEDETAAAKTIGAYAALLRGERRGSELWRELRAQSQLGVTRGTLA